PILADCYDSAIRNKHDVLLAESMVAVGRTVYYIEKGGEKRFVNADDYAKLTKEGWINVPGVPTPLDSANSLLTIYADVATKINLATLAHSQQNLADERGYHIVANYQPSAGDAIVEFLGSAVVRGILLAIFMYSVYTALQIPGHGAPEAIAIVSLGLLLGIPLLNGYAQWYEIIAIFAGLALLAF